MEKTIKLIDELAKNEGSYNKAGKKLGISGASINKIRHGENIPSDETIFNLCKILKVEPMVYLIEARKDKNKGEVKKVWEKIEKKLINGIANVAFLAYSANVINDTYCILCQIAGFKNSPILKGQII